MNSNSVSLKTSVAAHWQNEPCGVRGLAHTDRREFFQSLRAERYRYEPHIGDFARFSDGSGKWLLEIGVGAGTDYVNWLAAGARAVGIDLTEAAVRLTREHAELEGLRPTLARTDCEHLPFGDACFDAVYSYGVIHHSPDTSRAVAEIRRVLKPGGTAKVMIYHTPSITGLMLWVLHCVFKLRPWKSSRWAVANFLESPGTKVFSVQEARQLFAAFRNVSIETALGTGDLLLMKRSTKYQHAFAAIAWRLYPRFLVRRLGARFGLVLLVTASK